jgi:ABC-2 type transport system ATP-binding protein
VVVVTGVVLRGVSCHYRRRTALADVSLQLGTGVTAVMGRNGAGKTTLLRVLATVLRPDGGDVRLLDLDPHHAGQLLEIRRRLGYLPQEFGFYRAFTAWAFVDYVAILKELHDPNLRRDEVRRVLDLVDLGDAAQRRMRTLSVGVQRRIGLAQALLGRPRLVVLDEPTAGLDADQRARFRELLAGLAQQATVVVATHAADDVSGLARDILVLDAGRVLHAGTADSLLERARGRVWTSNGTDAGSMRSRPAPGGRTRHVGTPPAGTSLDEPTLEDAYLLLLGESGLEVHR